MRKTSLVLCERLDQVLAAGGPVLVVTPTTCARSQAVECLHNHGLLETVRILGCQKLSPREQPLTLGALVTEAMFPFANDVAKANTALNREIEAFRNGARLISMLCIDEAGVVSAAELAMILLFIRDALGARREGDAAGRPLPGQRRKHRARCCWSDGPGAIFPG